MLCKQLECMPGMQSVASVSSDNLKKNKNKSKKTKQMIATLINMYNLNMNLS